MCVRSAAVGSLSSWPDCVLKLMSCSVAGKETGECFENDRGDFVLDLKKKNILEGGQMAEISVFLLEV